MDSICYHCHCFSVVTSFYLVTVIGWLPVSFFWAVNKPADWPLLTALVVDKPDS